MQLSQFKRELAQMNKKDWRVATQTLTGHAALNHHLSRLIAPSNQPAHSVKQMTKLSPIFLGNVQRWGV